MSGRDVIELERRLRADLPRLTPPPPRGLDDLMVKRAVAYRQNQKSWLRVELPQLLKAAGVVVGGVAAGLVLGGLFTGSPFAGPPASAYAPPLQAACDNGPPRIVPPDTEIEVPTDEGMEQERREDCLHVGTGLPVADLTLAGWNYRCPDGSCWSAGTQIMLEILANLGPAYTGPTDVTLPGSGVPLRIEFRPRPHLMWRSVDGTEGRSTVVSIDLTLLAQEEGGAFAIVGDGPAYEVPDELARKILLTYFKPIP